LSLTAPANGATNQPLRPTFQWTAAGQAPPTGIQVATDPTFTNPVLDVSDATAPATRRTPTSRATPSITGGPGRSTVRRGRVERDLPFFATSPCPATAASHGARVAYTIDFEAGGRWTHSGSGDSWALSAARVHSGAAAFQANDPSTFSDQRLVSPVVDPAAEGAGSPSVLELAGDGVLGSDSCWDGGLVEISTDDGGTWTSCRPRSCSPTPTTGRSTPSPTSRLVRRSAGLAQVGGGISAYAGQTCGSAFRLGSDYSEAASGWYIDDVLVQACEAGGLPLPTASIGVHQRLVDDMP